MENPVALNVCGNFPLATTEWVGLTETDSNKWPAFCLQCIETVLLSILTDLCRELSFEFQILNLCDENKKGCGDNNICHTDYIFIK